jgi:UDP-3-O-[3-hydroxymyristoyl] glucosamine N-acyltransferase
VISGSPAIENKVWLRASAVFAKLPEILKRVRALERRLGGREDPEA